MATPNEKGAFLGAEGRRLGKIKKFRRESHGTRLRGKKD